MQPIGKNTYIDDTLITCVEYQLFIDELLEIKQYFQPDHWMSYQFPSNQARAPILGVRHNDALKFCEWLSNRESGEWRYRLPSMQEAAEHPMQSTLEFFPVGFWTMGTDNQSQFAWNGPAPNNPRHIDYHPGNLLAVNSNAAITRAYDRACARPLHLEVARQPKWDLSLDVDLNNILALALDRNLAKAPSLAIELVQHADSKLILSRAHDLIDYLNRQIEGDLEPGNELYQIRARALGNALTRNSALALSRTILNDFFLTDGLANEQALDLYFDIFTLQLRISGRSPAFEGIRIVKEHVKVKHAFRELIVKSKLKKSRPSELSR